MMLDHLILPAVDLFVLYCAGRFVRPVGDFYTTLFGAAASLGRVAQQWLDRLSGSGSNPNKASSLALISRLVGFIVGLTLLLGESVSSFVASPVLFDSDISTAQLPIHGVAAPALAVMVFAVCATSAMLALEAAGWVPPDMEIFNWAQSKRRLFRWVAAICVVLAVLTMAALYADRVFYLIDPLSDITVNLKIAIMLLVALQLIPTTGAALVMVIHGLHSIAQLALGMARFGAGVLVAAESVGRHFSRPSRTHTDEGRVPVPAHSVKEGETSMDEQCVSFGYIGKFGDQMRSILESVLIRLDAAYLVRSAGSVNIDRLPGPVSVGQDVSPPSTHRKSIRNGSDTITLAYQETCNRLAVAISDTHRPLPTAGQSFWFFIDGDALEFAMEMLRTLRRRQPDDPIVVVTQIDEGDLRSETTRKRLEPLKQLWRDAVITTTVIFSARSAFTATVKHSGGERKQMEFVAHTVAALLLSGTHSSLNDSCAEVLRDLGKTPFVSCAFASDRLAPPRGLALPRWLQRRLPGRYWLIGEWDDFKQQAEYVITLALTEPDYRAIQQGLPPDMSVHLICASPLHWKSKSFEPLRDALSTFVRRSFPTTRVKLSGLVCANGVPMHVADAPLDDFYMQATCIFPLSDEFPGDGGDQELVAALQEWALGSAAGRQLTDEALRKASSDGVSKRV